MRRVLSTFLILFFWLGPLSVLLPASEDARMPACCRRHGAHHCAMAMQTAVMLAEDASGKHIVTAPSTCPAYPGSTAATTTAPQAMAAALLSLPMLLAQPHSSAAGRATARLSQIRTRAGRGPPVIAFV